ncbi:MAG: FtsX-like permease family protein [Actinobacteria bacterium]|nr:FtsX-like permease family protein [Actinomycetota bacterium]
MSNSLNKKLLRDLPAHAPQAVAAIIIIALGIVMFSGLLMSQRSLKSSIDDFYRGTRYEDFSVQVNSAPTATAGILSRLDNVKAVEARREQEVLAFVNGSHLTVRVISLPGNRRPRVNDVRIESGRYLDTAGKNACLAEQHLADEFGLKPGDAIRLDSAGDNINLRVNGAVSSPEYLRLVAGLTEFVADPARFGVIFVAEAEARRIFGPEEGFNKFVVRVRDRKRLSETMEKAEAVLAPYGVIGLTRGSDERSASLISFDVSNMGKIAAFFAILILAVASIALYITITRLVVTQQREIGLSRAVGYGSGAILGNYLGFALILGALGSVLGLFGGYFLCRFFLSIYSNALGLPAIVKASFRGDIAAAGIGAGLLFSALGALIPARRAVRMKPADAIRAEAGLSLELHEKKAGASTAGYHRTPAWLRLAFRNLFRNRRRTLLTCLGIAMALSALVAARGSVESLDYVLDKYFQRVLRWDVSAAFSSPQNAEALRLIGELNGVSRVEPMADLPALLSADGRSSNIEVQAYEDGTNMHGSFPTRGSKPWPGPGEIVLNRGTAGELHLELGEPVEVSTVLGNASLKAVGFVSEPFKGICYMNLRQLRQLAGADYFNVVIAKVRPGKEARVASAFGSLPGVAKVTTRNQIRETFEEMLGATKPFMNIIYVLILAITFAIVFAIITINVLERRREIATARTLGTGMGRIFSTLTAETMTIGIIAIPPGIVLGKTLEWLLIVKLMGSQFILIDVVLSSGAVALIVAVFLAVLVLSELPSLRQLKRLDLARVIKERAD